MKNFMKKYVGTPLLAVSLFGGTIISAEKSGITNAFVQANDAICHAAFEAHRRYPLLVWGDYGNPHTDPEARLLRYRIGHDIELGLLGLLLGGLAIILGAKKLNEKKDLSQHINPYSLRE